MKRLALLFSCAALLCSCAGVNIKQPDIGNVKKVAILSVTGTEDFEDIEVAEGKKETLLSVVGNIIKDNVEMINEPQVNIVTHGANALFQALNGIEGWSVIPFEQVNNNEEVKAYFEDKNTMEKIEDFANKVAPRDGKRLVPARGMYELSFDKVSPSGAHWVNGERVEAPVLRALGKMCQSLDVDAIAVAEYSFFYETGMMTNITRNVTPIVFVNVVLVDKNGEKVLHTDRGWKKVEGSESAKVNGDYVNLREDKSVKAYNIAIDKIMDEFRKEAAKKLGK
jgi:hypothetical protein